MHKWLYGTVTTLILALAFGVPAQAAEFYAGKTINLYIGYSPGSAYDKYARLLAKEIGRFLPGNPKIVPRNMPGAGSMRATNYIHQVAPKDGTAWGAPSRAIATEPLLYGKRSKAAFKTPLELNWIGSLNTEVGVAAVWHTTGVKTWAEARRKPIVVAISSSRGGISSRVVNSIFKTNFQQVCCYGGGNTQNLAMERGEVEGRIGWSWSSLRASKMDWLKTGKIHLLMQLGLQKHPEIPADVPLAQDLVQTEKDKMVLKIVFSTQSMGRPYIMPPGVPPSRVSVVRRAFMKMVKDPAFLAKAAKRHLEINDPKSGKDIEALIRDVYASPEAAKAAAQIAVKSGKIKMVRKRKKRKKRKK